MPISNDNSSPARTRRFTGILGGIHLQNILEEERTRIAREIHDELGQQLTGLKFETYLIKKIVSSDETAVQEKLSTVVSLINEAIKSVARISTELRPRILDNLGLVAALKWHGQEFEKRTGIFVRFFSTVKDIDLERNQSINIYRVYQEALTNVARHASATRVFTDLTQNDTHISLMVKNNGRGFDINEVKTKNSCGLTGMKERASMLNGALTIKSSKSEGTTVILKILRTSTRQ